MYSLKRFLKIYFLFLKRNAKKKSLWMAVLILPVALYLITGLNFDNGKIIRVGITGNRIEIVNKFYEELKNDSDIIKYYIVDSNVDIDEELDSGNADVIIEIDNDIESEARKYFENGAGFIKVNERQNTIVSRLIREKVYMKIFPYIAYVVYEDNIEKILSDNQDSNIDKEKIRAYFDNIEINPDIVIMKNITGEEYSGYKNESVAFSNVFYGIIAIWVYIFTFLALMNYNSDKGNGLFLFVGKTDGVLLGYILNFMTVPIIIAILSDFIIRRENNAVNVMLLSLCIISFVIFVDSLVKNIYLLSSIFCISLPILFIINPIFINLHFGRFEFIKYLLPMYLYMTDAGTLQFAMYILVCMTFGIVGNKLRNLF